MHANYINGAWVDGVATRTNINPSNLADVVGEYAQADAAQTALAIAAARAAAYEWAHTTGQRRADILDAVGTEILARHAELGRLQSREEGKHLPEGHGEDRHAESGSDAGRE